MGWSIVSGGKVVRWQPFIGSLGDFRVFLAGLSPGDGILVIGTDSVCGHMADLARLSGRPAVFSSDTANGEVLEGLTEYLERGTSCRDSVRAFVRVSGTWTDTDGNARGGKNRCPRQGWMVGNQTSPTGLISVARDYSRTPGPRFVNQGSL